ncbi:MAG: ParB/RepB/Spo0J family partition protein [Acidobacteria bacterium]|nr:ParB/RepB/Spo0J family partition protein [Acidobacteriota bacterium]
MRHDSHYVEELTKSNRSVGRIIPINQIEPNPKQPRTEVGDLSELTSSIKQKGVLEPILVKPRGNGTWMIIAGERRWRSAKLAGLAEVPCIELNIDDKSIAEIALIENLQRKDLTIWEEADGLAYLCERFNYTHDEIAKKIGKSRTTVTEAMSIAGLPETIRQKCLQANITAKSTLLEIARQFDEKAMHDFFDEIEKKILTREEIRRKVHPQKSDNKSIKNINKRNQKQFIFSSKQNDFVLEIRFGSINNGETKDILRALKETFEEIKNNSNKDA